MKRIGILRIFAGLAALALLLGPAAPAMQAEFECKQELMAGAWGRAWESQWAGPDARRAMVRP